MHWHLQADNSGRTKPIPKWQRSIGVDDKGAMYVPATMAGIDERAVFMKASFDGVACIEHLNHLLCRCAGLHCSSAI